MGLEYGQPAAIGLRGHLQHEAAPPASLRPSRAKGPVVVEFIGIPGSGKTTLCTAIVSDLRRDGFKVVTEHEYFRWMKRPLHKKYASLISHGWRTWYFAIHLYWFLYRCTLLRGHALAGMVFHLTCMRVWLFEAASSKEPVLVLLDGFAWFRLTNRLRDYPATDLGTPKQLKRTVGLFYPRCELHWIFKTIPVEEAVQRISRRMLRDRAPKGIETSSPERRRVVLNRQTQLYQRVCDAIRFLHDDHVHLIDGAEPIPEQVHRIKTVITRSVQQSPLVPAMYEIVPSARPQGHGRICEY
jgi:thymidylate kinase